MMKLTLALFALAVVVIAEDLEKKERHLAEKWVKSATQSERDGNNLRNFCASIGKQLGFKPVGIVGCVEAPKPQPIQPSPPTAAPPPPKEHS